MQPTRSSRFYLKFAILRENKNNVIEIDSILIPTSFDYENLKVRLKCFLEKLISFFAIVIALEKKINKFIDTRPNSISKNKYHLIQKSDKDFCSWKFWYKKIGRNGITTLNFFIRNTAIRILNKTLKQSRKRVYHNKLLCCK